MCLSKEKGGLGIRGHLNLNRAIIGKWSWRFAIEDNTPWKDLIKTNIGLWKEIRKVTLLLKSNNVFLVGEGSRVRFWEDTWCGSNPLYTTFPHLYSLVDSKGANVAEVWDAL